MQIQKRFTKYDLGAIKKLLRKVIPVCSSIPVLNKNSTPAEILDAINFLEIQGKYNENIWCKLENSDKIYKME